VKEGKSRSASETGGREGDKKRERKRRRVEKGGRGE